jgi:hypothetical protein
MAQSLSQDEYPRKKSSLTEKNMKREIPTNHLGFRRTQP